jgi:hypothetical protein
MDNNELLEDLNHDFRLDPGKKLTVEQLRALLTARIDNMITSDFTGLVNLLYKIDIDENKLKKLLSENEDAAEVVSDLIIERQLQKINTKARYSQNGPASEEEKW